MSGDQETRLLTRAAEGETEAFRVLFEAHRDAVFRLAYRLTGALDVAEDLAQECFLGLIRSPRRFDARRGSLRQYLYGTVRNLVRQRWQAGGHEVPLDDDSDVDADPRHLTMGGRKIEGVEVSEAVQSAIDRLPVLQREALVLFEFEELSLEEIAAGAGCDAGTVKSRLHRARAGLRRALAPWWNQVSGVGADRPQKAIVCPTGEAGGVEKPAPTRQERDQGVARGPGGAPHFFREPRRPQAHDNRPEKAMVCPAKDGIRGVRNEPAE